MKDFVLAHLESVYSLNGRREKLIEQVGHLNVEHEVGHFISMIIRAGYD